MTTDPVAARPHRDFPMPRIVAEHSRAWLDTPPAERTVATPRTSSTVMLLREAATEGVEVFVLRRASGMPFAPGMIAFPGGGVDARDADPDLPWAGPSPTQWAARLGVGDGLARELVVAAAREVFEECGVLLAGPDADTVVADLTDPSWDREREALLDRSQSFAQMLIRLGLVLRSDLLSARGHWTTPVCEPRRYDTRFFAARMPEGQIADDRSSEAEVARWMGPRELLDAREAGTEILLPPTQVSVEQLLGIEDLDAWLAREVPVRPVLPWPAEVANGLRMRCPLDADGFGLPDDAVAPGVRRVRCDNPSPMTLEGTNTWILGPVEDRVVVVDPGPLHEEHLRAVRDRVHALGATVALTVLTHHHDDHVGGLERWVELTGSPVVGAGHGDLDEISTRWPGLQVIPTPGHTADSICLLLDPPGVLLTGDTVLGRGTSVVTWPDGDLTAYLDSLRTLREVVAERGIVALLPGHGPVVTDPGAHLDGYLRHRQERLDQVAGVLREWEVDPGPEPDGDLADRVVERVYADVPREVWPAARQSVMAQLAHLGREGLSGPGDAADPGR